MNQHIKSALRSRLKLGAIMLAATAVTFGFMGTAMAAPGTEKFKGLLISPPSSTFDLSIDDVKSGEMSVENSTDHDMDVKMSVTNYSINNDNYSAPNYEGNSKYSLMKNWIKLDKTNFTLKPGEHQIVKYTINPRQAGQTMLPGGTQYAAIFAENIPQKSNQSGVTAISRVGTVVRANMIGGQTIEKAEITNKKINWYQPNSPLKASFTVKNEGNIAADVSYSMRVTSAINGGQVFKTEGQSSSIYPETTRELTAEWPKMGVGFYNVELTTTVNGKSETVKKLVCTIPIWIILLIMISIASLVAYGVINYRISKEGNHKKSVRRRK